MAGWRGWRLGLAATLALCAGFVDVLCVTRYGAFPATQTGNLIYIGASLHLLLASEHRLAAREEKVELESIGYRTAVFFASCAGAYAFCALEHAAPRRAASVAAPLVGLLMLSADVIPWLASERVAYSTSQEEAAAYPAARWCVVLVAFALGGVHFLCSPNADGSRLRTVTFAATGHVHKLTKLVYKLLHRRPCAASEYEVGALSLVVVGCMLTGALAAAACMHLSERGDRWLLSPVAVVLFVVFSVHDRVLEPVGGSRAVAPPAAWAPASLSEPLTAAEGGPSSSAAPETALGKRLLHCLPV